MINGVKRLRKEWQNIQNNPDENIILTPLDESDILEWRAQINGPPDSCYSGFQFELKIVIGSEYPLLPPTITFITKVFHPNVLFETGDICLDILKKEWSPAWTLQSACRAIITLLGDPAADSPLNCDAGNMIRAGDSIAFNSMAKMYAIEYAKKSNEVLM